MEHFKLQSLATINSISTLLSLTFQCSSEMKLWRHACASALHFIQKELSTIDFWIQMTVSVWCCINSIKQLMYLSIFKYFFLTPNNRKLIAIGDIITSHYIRVVFAIAPLPSSSGTLFICVSLRFIIIDSKSINMYLARSNNQNFCLEHA